MIIILLNFINKFFYNISLINLEKNIFKLIHTQINNKLIYTK